MPIEPRAPSRAARVYAALRTGVLSGRFRPGEPLKAQNLADELHVSLAVVREALLRLVGEGLADRTPNHGFTVPTVDADHWQQLAEARIVIEPAMLRKSIDRGDLDWEARVRAAHHRLAGTRAFPDGGPTVSDEWAEAHRRFHRTLLEACGNRVLLASFDRMWDAGELTRRWSGVQDPGRQGAAEHRALERAVLQRDGPRAAQLLAEHISATATALTADPPRAPGRGADDSTSIAD